MTWATLVRRTRLVRVLFLFGLAALVPVACGASAAPSPTAGASSGSPAASPSGPASSAGPKPSPTRWPPSAVASVVALGAADGEIWKAGTDLGLAAETADLELMWGAADGLATLIEELTPNIERLAAYPYTRPLADRYEAAFPVLFDGATRIRDAIDAGDAGALTAGTQRLAEGVRLYGDVRALLGGEDYVEQAVLQQRLLLN